MKKLTIFIIAVFVALTVFTQNYSSATYSFSTYNGQPIPLTNTDTLLHHSDTASTPLISIGFPFTFSAQQYTTMSVSTDGFIRLGEKAILTDTNDLRLTSNYPMIAPHWDDLETLDTGTVVTKLLGTAPNRIRVVQWHVARHMTDVDEYENVVFQALLYERTGKIRFLYRYAPINYERYSVGIGAYVNSMPQTIQVSVLQNNAFYNSTMNVVNIYSIHASDLQFVADSTVPNTPDNITINSGADCMVLTWSDRSTQEDFFNIYRSTDGMNFTYIQSVPTVTKALTGKRYSFHDYNLNANTTYYYKVSPTTMGSNPNYTAVYSATTVSGGGIGH